MNPEQYKEQSVDDTLKFNTTNRKADEFDKVLGTYRVLGRTYVEMLMTKDRAAEIVILATKIDKLFMAEKTNCLMASLAMAVVMESSFKKVFGEEVEVR